MTEEDILVYCTTKPTPKKRRRIKNRPEQALQIAVAGYLDLALPDSAVWWHIPNGGNRSKAEAGLFKAMGVKAGVPDIQILWNKAPKSSARHTAIFIELKAPGGSISRNQRQMRKRLVDLSCPYLTTTSVENIEDFLRGLGVPLKASLASSTTSRSRR